MARTRQPQGSARVDPSYPYARNLRGAWIADGNSPLRNISNRGGIGDLTAVGSPLLVPTPYGIGVSLNGSSQYLTNTSNAAITTTPFTFLFRVYVSSAQATSARLMDISTGTTVDRVLGVWKPDGGNLQVQHYDGSANNIAEDPSSFVLNAWYSIAARFDSNSSRSLFVNGVNVATNTGSGITGGINRLTIGYDPWASAQYLNGVVAVPLAFDAALPSEEIALLHQNPYRWAAPQRRIWVQLGPAAGGAGTDATIAGTQITDVGAVTVEATTGAAIAGTQASDVGAVTAEATIGAAIAGTQASDVAALVVDSEVGTTSCAIGGVQASDVGAIAVEATLGLELTGTQASDLGYIVVEATLPAAMAGTQASDVAAVTVTAASSSIWTDIPPVSTIWTDL